MKLWVGCEDVYFVTSRFEDPKESHAQLGTGIYYEDPNLKDRMIRTLRAMAKDKTAKIHRRLEPGSKAKKTRYTNRRGTSEESLSFSEQYDGNGEGLKTQRSYITRTFEVLNLD